MGCSIAQVFAAAGKTVTLYDTNIGIDPIGKVEANIDIMIGKCAADGEYKKYVLEHIGFCSHLQKAVEEAELVVECVFEDMQIKRGVFAELEALCGTETVFATNTSVMSPTEIAEDLKHKGRFIGMHFWNPAHLMPLVELVENERDTAGYCRTVRKGAAAGGEKAGSVRKRCSRLYSEPFAACPVAGSGLSRGARDRRRADGGYGVEIRARACACHG